MWRSQRWIGIFCLCAGTCLAQGNRGYYRFPAIHNTTVIFTSEGDLWQVGIAGGVAQRLTSHPGDETRAAFSPDGSTIAYSADYEGPTEVYTMPAGGGLPQRRTFDGGRAGVVGWTPDGKILYATARYSTLPADQLAVINKDNRIDLVPLSQASQGSYDAKGATLYFTRFPFQGSQTKRYEGGTAQNIWKYVSGKEAVPLTGTYTGTSKDAMWWNGRVYFLSDRDGTMNLWSMDENGKDAKQLTKHQGWDIQSPSLSDGRIVYQMGSDLRLFEIATGTDRGIDITLPSDFDHLREHWVKNPIDYITSVHFAPDGNSVEFTARGRVFVAPVKQGRWVDVTYHKPGRYADAHMMPDGKSLVVLSTASGEIELEKLPANGVGVPEQLTHSARVLRWDAVPSGDGKWIAHQDKDNELWILNAETKVDKKADTAADSQDSPAFGALCWSPDSRWLAYSRPTANGVQEIVVYNVETGSKTSVTTDRYQSDWAAWSPDGKWLYFLSDRSLKSVVRSPWGERQPDPFFDKPMKIYQIALKKGTRSPFEPADELHPDTPEAAPGGATPPEKPLPASGKADKPKVDIDLDGIAGRVEEVPAAPGNYAELKTTGKRLCWLVRDLNDQEKNALQCMDVANKGQKPETLSEGVRQFELSADGKKMMIRRQFDVMVVDAAVKEAVIRLPQTIADSQVNIKEWTFPVIPTDEIREAFLDAWRLHRDYFYDRKMHGIAWTTMRDKYGELVNRVRDRAELNDLLGQMVGELSALHTFVRGGDLRRGPDQVQTASLGARLVRDSGAGGYVVEHVYRFDPDRPDLRPPLARPGVDVSDGDVIVSINGRELLSAVDPGELLRNQAEHQVLLEVRPKGKSETRRVVVKPVSMRDETNLRYDDWEYTRRQMVEHASSGEIGYVHLRAMGRDDINRWAEEFYPVFNRAGLIIDVRHNRGGNIDSWILGKLLRKPWMYWQARTGKPVWNMQYAFRGHLVVLCDQDTASDGEAFAEGFRRLGLGKVIGTRTWGGEIWLSANNFLADQGIATAAEMGVYGPEGKWLIEGHGVDPDIVVDNGPHAAFEGKDTQLETAITYLEKLIREQPMPVPAPPAYPDKTFRSTGTAQ